ncbi:WD40-repeat-containing domain protein [Mycena rosella]|uniref:WD40-repeat-containing domain protein n=1 Tax=Mycena rosella TaxID=1033263 RepID=A0AAD7MA44_MYCRO|nr:WD40-repeat-containing domain protein [Mycena rosella]
MNGEDVASVSSVSDFDPHTSVFRNASDGNRNLDELLRDFKGNCESLERQLEMFASSVRKLGSSLGLYKGSRGLQQQLSSVRRLLDDESQIERLIFNKTLSSFNKPPQIHKDLWLLVDAITIFSTAWDDFPEFADNDRRHCLVSLEQHLLVWLNILGPYENSPEFLRCIRELLSDTIFELDHVNRRLADFIATGVQEISFAQKHSTQILLNSATIATFFSAVTVTTIQYSFQNVTSPLEISVNTLWLSSLVLSVSSAINSLLAMTWRQAIYSTPQRRVPWWVRIWFKQTPIILLSLSVLSFLGGLLCFVLLTQNRITKLVVSILMAIVALGLGAISVWFAWERWDFSRLRRTLWLQEAHEKLESSWGVFLYNYICSFIWKPTPTSLPTPGYHFLSRAPSIPDTIISNQSITERLSNAGNWPRGPAHDPPSLDVATSTATYSDAVFPDFAPQRIKLGRGDDAVRHIQFSPKGTWFAACTRSICYICQVQPQISVHQSLKHPFGQLRQLEWSPDEKRLLIRVSGGIELWEIKQNKLENRQKEWMGRVIKKVQWINSTAFLVMTEDTLIQFKIGDAGHLSQERSIEFDMTLYTFAVAPTRNCVLLIAGHRSRVREDIRFPKRTVRSVLNYRLDTGEFSHSFPLLCDARWISVSLSGRHVLLGFSDQKAPELWTFDLDRISFTHRFPSNFGKERFSGPPHFVGPQDEFVACATLNNSIQIWKRDRNEVVSSLPMSANHNDPRGTAMIPMMTWNPGSAMFLSATADVNVWVPNIRVIN